MAVFAPSFRSAASRLALWLLAGLCLAGPAAAQSPLVLMVPYPAGALSDVVARAVAPPLARVLERPVVVENLGGAAGTLAARRVLGQPADGNVLFQGSPNELILAPLVQSASRVASTDFRLVQIIGEAPLVLVTRSDLPAGSLAEMIALARDEGLGRPLSYGSSGVGSLYHVLAHRLAQRVGVPMVHVPYRGGAPLLTDLAGGVVDFAILPAAGPTFALVDTGRIKLLGTLEPAHARVDEPRLRALPSLAADLNLPDFAFSIWSGYFVPAGTPDAVAQRLNRALAEALRHLAVAETLEAQGARRAPAMTLAQAQAFYERETARYRTLARDADPAGNNPPGR